MDYSIVYDRKLKTYTVCLGESVLLITRNANIARRFISQHESK